MFTIVYRRSVYRYGVYGLTKYGSVIEVASRSASVNYLTHTHVHGGAKRYTRRL